MRSYSPTGLGVEAASLCFAFSKKRDIADDPTPSGVPDGNQGWSKGVGPKKNLFC